jgi:hypothetical protein
MILVAHVMRWAGHLARMWERRGLYMVLVGKPEGKKPLRLFLCFKDFTLLSIQRLLYEILHKTSVKHLNCKLYYRHLHLKYLCNLARHWLQAVWVWHSGVETCRNVIICEIIVHLLVIAQNKKSFPLFVRKIRKKIPQRLFLYIIKTIARNMSR